MDRASHPIPDFACERNATGMFWIGVVFHASAKGREWLGVLHRYRLGPVEGNAECGAAGAAGEARVEALAHGLRRSAP
jgi:hypothetical protein